jgi:hypothetical protein
MKTILDGAHVKLGTELLIDWVRVKVKEGVLDHKNVQFKFKDKILKCDEEGQINEHWPEGFCDQHMNALMRILKRSEKEKEKRKLNDNI